MFLALAAIQSWVSNAIDCAILGTTADLKSSSAPKITQSNHSPTAMLRIVEGWLGFTPRIHFLRGGVISVIASGLKIRVAIHFFNRAARCKEQWVHKGAWSKPNEPQKRREKDR